MGEFLRKACNTNPRRQFKHFRSPSRGKAALQKLKVFEGIPYPYDQRKRMVVPQALKVLRLRPQANFCVLGELASHVGWSKADVVSTLEAKRKVKSEQFFQNKQKK